MSDRYSVSRHEYNEQRSLAEELEEMLVAIVNGKPDAIAEATTWVRERQAEYQRRLAAMRERDRRYDNPTPEELEYKRVHGRLKVEEDED